MSDRWSFQYPQLYKPGQLNMYFNKKAFLRCLLHGCYSSLLLFFVPWAAMQDTVRDDGRDIADYQSFAILLQTCLLVVVGIQVRQHERGPSWVSPRWRRANQTHPADERLRLAPAAVSGHPLLDGCQPLLHLGQPGGLLRPHLHHVQQRDVPHLHLLLPVPGSVQPSQHANARPLTFGTPSAPQSDGKCLSGTGRNSLNQPNVWLTILLTTLLTALPVVVLRFVILLLRPTINDKVSFPPSLSRVSTLT